MPTLVTSVNSELTPGSKSIWLTHLEIFVENKRALRRTRKKRVRSHYKHQANTVIAIRTTMHSLMVKWASRHRPRKQHEHLTRIGSHFIETNGHAPPPKSPTTAILIFPSKSQVVEYWFHLASTLMVTHLSFVVVIALVGGCDGSMMIKSEETWWANSLRENRTSLTQRPVSVTRVGVNYLRSTDT
jgi:hypothetical protein